MSAAHTSERLLDAQVAWLLGRFTGDGPSLLVEETVDDLLTLGRSVTVGSLVDAATAKQLIHEMLQKVPASSAASTLVGVAADTAYAGPSEPVTISQIIDREHVALLLTEFFGLADPAEVFLDRIAESPIVATVASRFVGRIVNEVLATNRAVAEKIPGVGSLVSLGSSMAGKVVGAADKQFEALLGDTAGKGATFAMRRLNKVVIETLRDDSTREAALQIFDLYADTPLGGTARLGDLGDAHRVAGLLQDIAISGAASEPALALVDSLVDGFLAVYRDEQVSTLVEDLGLTRDDLVARALAVAPRVLAAAVASGEVERLLRDRLEPFFNSPEVAAILG